MLTLETARTIVGIFGNVTALVLFLSPLPTIVKIWKKKSVEQYSAAPYLATLINCGLWTLYGTPLVHPNSFLVLSINAAGLAIVVAFLSVYLLCCSDRKRRLRLIVVVVVEALSVAALAVLVLTLARSWRIRSNVVGTAAVVGSVVMYASPLAVMKLVITTKSVEYMPLPISLCAFANGLCWTLYALIRIDPYILVPNGIGALSGLAQIMLYAKYYKSNKIAEVNNADIEEGTIVKKDLSDDTNKPTSNQ